jgi:hypothetical protein
MKEAEQWRRMQINIELEEMQSRCRGYPRVALGGARIRNRIAVCKLAPFGTTDCASRLLARNNDLTCILMHTSTRYYIVLDWQRRALHRSPANSIYLSQRCNLRMYLTDITPQPLMRRHTFRVAQPLLLAKGWLDLIHQNACCTLRHVTGEFHLFPVCVF